MVDVPNKTTPRKKPSTSTRGRAALLAIVLGTLDAWLAHRRKTHDSIDDMIATLLGRVSWDVMKPASARAAIAAICEGTPTSDLEIMAHQAELERTILDEVTSPEDDLIPESDCWLLVYTTEACERQSCYDFVQEARELPRKARAKIWAILSEINCPEGGRPLGAPQLAELHARLVDEVLVAGGSQSFADAFILPPGEWTRRHVVPAARVSEPPSAHAPEVANGARAVVEMVKDDPEAAEVVSGLVALLAARRRTRRSESEAK